MPSNVHVLCVGLKEILCKTQNIERAARLPRGRAFIAISPAGERATTKLCAVTPVRSPS